MKEHEELPTSVKDYMENGPFEILDTPGQEEVVLTRSFGDEKYVFLCFFFLATLFYLPGFL